ncbi:hypothetical protein I2485_06905 [Nesterenkonia sp. E16_7]|uniref:hypothetical protein n=1 Tax=unclassified Nesterenkonia TaxID=2629769 RepID=UPI001A9188E6|nr:MULTISPECIES: hypothetical protein [unclassified Nesterenkonia]MBO0596604.1 hypothetical protein [Nesterenkonia sp. E16_10]MBO0598381.1 hypothetical protein [Nesterenkonia sp. E16_7]
MKLGKNHTSVLAAAALGGLLLTACTGVEATPDADEGTVAPPRAAAPIDDPAHTHEEVTVECSDPEALAANEGHAPAGWPQGWDETGPMPDPECHPDFIEVRNWEYLEEFEGEGIETSTLTRSASATDDSVNAQLWEQSLARAEWSPSAN